MEVGSIVGKMWLFFYCSKRNKYQTVDIFTTNIPNASSETCPVYRCPWPCVNHHHVLKETMPIFLPAKKTASLSDQDGDKKLTLSEFISLPVGTVENQQAQDVDDDWVRERKKEFEDVIDADKNGIVTMEELEVRRRIPLF